MAYRSISELLTPEEMEFVKRVYQNPGGKIEDCFHFIEDDSETGGSSVSLWKKPEELGIIECVGSYKWEPVGPIMQLLYVPS